MKTIAQIEQEILKITIKINEEFPELSKFIKEIPMKASDNDKDVNIKNLKDYYNSLVEMLKKYAKTHSEKDVNKEGKLIGYPPYSPSKDIYIKEKKEMELEPNDLSKTKTPNEEAGKRNEKDFYEDMSGKDLDVPGSELDDQQEKNGNEDEENNYYSLGGDNHNDLEEDKG